MGYGIAKYYLRLPDSKFWYEKNNRYVFVDEGFFEVRNIFHPVPLYFLMSQLNTWYFLGIYRIFSQKLWYSWMVSTLFTTWAGLGVMAGAHRLW
jgi:hypothetical protein